MSKSQRIQTNLCLINYKKRFLWQPLFIALVKDDQPNLDNRHFEEIVSTNQWLHDRLASNEFTWTRVSRHSWQKDYKNKIANRIWYKSLVKLLEKIKINKNISEKLKGDNKLNSYDCKQQ